MRTLLLLMVALASDPTPAPKVHHVVISTLKFQPTELAVAEGEVVEFENRDFFQHTVTALDGAFASKPLVKGDTFRWTAKGKGSHAYLCTLHPVMTGTIEVK